MTFNLGPSQHNPERVIAAIERENADIVAVQELVPTTADRLKERVGQRYPFSVLDPIYATTGLLSRYPIQSIEWFQPGVNSRKMLHATVQVQGTGVQVFAVHPVPPRIVLFGTTRIPVGLDAREQETEILGLLGRVRAQNGPVLVMGDFNMTDQSPSYGRLTGRLKDTFAETNGGFGFTFPDNLTVNRIPFPGRFLRLDYIFHSASLSAETVRVMCGSGSDHCYLAAQLALAGNK